MNKTTILTCWLSLGLVAIASAAPSVATQQEMAMAKQWGARLSGSTPAAPFSFLYNGVNSADLLPHWSNSIVERDLGDHRQERTLTWSDTQTGLSVRCVAVQYSDFPVVEWTVYFKNEGSKDTPILENIQGIDTAFARGTNGEFDLHFAKGGPAEQDDFHPYTTILRANSSTNIATSGGRSSNRHLPYFNIEWPRQGVILAVGWPGQWAASFRRDATNGLRVMAGQELTHLKLHPGEEIRTPLTALLFWQGNFIQSQNLWRRWMVAHNMPRLDGKPLPPKMFACSSHQFDEMAKATEENQIHFIDRYREEKLHLDYWWMDAGWYATNGSWVDVGTWEIDTNRFPNGFKPISDHAHQLGMGSLVWFEPERVSPGTWLDRYHQDWILKTPEPNVPSRLLDLGNPAARVWLTDHVDKILTDGAIDFYRQDFNMEPLNYWRAADASDRQGMTENKHVTGYLQYWDELKRRHPKLLLDSCASGGRRLDLETMRRAVPLLRSDYLLEPVGEQLHTYGLAFWLPYFGTGFIDPVTYGDRNYFGSDGLGTNDAYAFRSVLCPNIINCLDVRKTNIHYAVIRKLFAEWEQVSPYLLGDYYPLTSYDVSQDVWLAWQFDRPDLNGGMIQAFRRKGSVYESARLKLLSLDPDASYNITDSDQGTQLQRTGRQLMNEGITVSLKNQPDAALITYTRVR